MSSIRDDVDLHLTKQPNTALAVVHGVVLTREKRVVASGGELSLYEPFALDRTALKVISCTYNTTGASDNG
jgi:hypothetical protein